MYAAVKSCLRGLPDTMTSLPWEGTTCASTGKGRQGGSVPKDDDSGLRHLLTVLFGVVVHTLRAPGNTVGLQEFENKYKIARAFSHEVPVQRLTADGCQACTSRTTNGILPDPTDEVKAPCSDKGKSL